jgi:hypothetical protein
MNDPFSGIRDPESPRPTRRRFQPGLVQEAFGALQDTLRPALQGVKETLRRAQRAAKEGSRRADRYGQDLWLRGKRNPRNFGLVGAAVAVTLVGAYALSASISSRSLCPATGEGKTPKFVVLMDSVAQLAAGSAVEIHYDVCGLASGTPYSGKVRLAQQRAAGKKKSAKPTPIVASFKDRTDGVATRRHQQLSLASIRPGAYTLELSVADNRGRERKRVQKILVKAR